MECTIKITLIVSAVLGGLVLCLLMFRSWYKSRKAIQMPLVEKMAGPILNKKHEESQLPFPKDDKKSALLQPQKEEIEEILDDEEPIKHSKHPSISKDNPLSSTQLKKIPVNNMNEFLGKLDNFSKAADQKNLDVDQPRLADWRWAIVAKACTVKRRIKPRCRRKKDKVSAGRK